MHSKMKKEGLLLVILDILRNESCHGYGIAERIEKMYGINRPSSGLIYPILSSLRKRGFVEVISEGKRDKKIYKITDAGLKFLRDNEKRLDETRRMLNNLGEFYRIGGGRLMDSMKMLIRNMDKLTEEERREIGKMICNLSRKIDDAVELSEYERED